MTQENSLSSTATGVSAWWRALSYFLLFVLLIGWAFSASMYEQLKAQVQHLEAKLVEVPQIREMSVLLDDDHKAAMLVSYEPTTHKLQVQRLNNVKEGREQSLHLWALSTDDQPRLLGVLTNRYQTTQLDVPPEALEGAQSLGLSVESKDNGPRNGQPNQPWLFKGWLVKKAI